MDLPPELARLIPPGVTLAISRFHDFGWLYALRWSDARHSVADILHDCDLEAGRMSKREKEVVIVQQLVLAYKALRGTHLYDCVSR